MKLSRSATVICIAALVALTLVVASADAAKIVRAGRAQNGKSIILSRGAQLVVSLKGNATTGYAWKVRSVSKSVLKPLTVKYVPNPNPKHLAGSGGVYKLRFSARTYGTTALRLVYARGKKSAGSYWLRVIVSGSGA
ncbi:MAG: protease inhibitor I42 family protein [Gaiellaceae bacterium]